MKILKGFLHSPDIRTIPTLPTILAKKSPVLTQFYKIMSFKFTRDSNTISVFFYEICGYENSRFVLKRE